MVLFLAARKAYATHGQASTEKENWMKKGLMKRDAGYAGLKRIMREHGLTIKEVAKLSGCCSASLLSRCIGGTLYGIAGRPDIKDTVNSGECH